MEKVDLVVVVNGQPAHVAANVNAPLHAVVQKALEETTNTGQPASEWEVRDASGEILSQDMKVNQIPGVTNGTRLFVNLKAGVGG